MKYDILTLEGAEHRITITTVDNTDLSNYTFYGNCACSCSTKSFIINGNEIVIPALKCGTYDYQLFAKNDDKEYMLLQGVIIADDRLSCTNNDEVSISSEITNLQISITAATNLSDYQNQILGKYANCKNVHDVKALDSNYQLDLTSKGQWLYDLTSLTDGQSMFFTCRNLTSFSSDLPALTNGIAMFQSCTNLTSFLGDLPNLTNGTQMFDSCKNLTSFSSDLSSLTSGRHMFYHCTNLIYFNSDLSALTDGHMMFDGCTNLTSFSVDLPNLTNGNCMFDGCTNLISFSSDLSALTNGENMFFRCKELTSFSNDLPALTNGNYMFATCWSITKWTVALPNLTNGYAMFAGCILDLESVQNIAETINDLTDDTPSTSFTHWGELTLSMQASLQDTADLETALAAIRAKGWTVEEQYK